MQQLSLRGFDKELERRIRQLARTEGISLNKAALKLFRKHDFLREDRHIYLSKNLTSHRDYKRLRGKKQSGRRKKKDHE